VDERQLHGTQPAVDVDVKASPEADQLLTLGFSSCTCRRQHRIAGAYALSPARQTAAVSLGPSPLR